MSTFLAPSRTRVRVPDSHRLRGRLSVVHTPNPAPRVPFAALVLTVLALGLVGLLMLNTSLQQGAFYARGLEGRAETLQQQREALEIQVAELREPQRVAARAAAMGMVPNENPAFLRLSDGTVLGRATPATAGSAPDFLAHPRGDHGAPVRSGRTGGAAQTASQHASQGADQRGSGR